VQDDVINFLEKVDFKCVCLIKFYLVNLVVSN